MIDWFTALISTQMHTLLESNFGTTTRVKSVSVYSYSAAVLYVEQ